jgi:RNA polymerase sigma factor (sigma-70 family)
MARGQLAQANIGLVAAMAGKVRLAGLDYDEAVSAGNMALLRSIEKFDVSLGFKFSTYACQAIRQHMLSAAKRANRYHNRFTTEYDEAMELSDYNERKVDQVELDCVDELMDILKDNRASLSQTEREVLCKRFALSSQDRRPAPMTLKQIGELIGVTKESVRQIQKRALRKLRLALEREYLAA